MRMVARPIGAEQERWPKCEEMMLLAATEDPELDEIEMSAAKNAIWSATVWRSAN